MPKDKRNARSRYIRYLRMPVIIAGFICLGHLHRGEGARIEDEDRTEMSHSVDAGRTQETVPEPMEFEASAYCIPGITKSGVPVAPGHVAADPDVLPLGSIIHVDAPLMNGIYQVLDTGSMIKGNMIDIYIPSYERSIEFGRRKVQVTVLRRGFADATQKVFVTN